MVSAQVETVHRADGRQQGPDWFTADGLRNELKARERRSEFKNGIQR
jgi:hypothetical protein